MISFDIHRDTPAANVNAEAAALRHKAESAAFQACKCFAGLWLTLDNAIMPLVTHQKNLHIAGYNRERAAVLETATARAKSAATLAKEAADAYTRIENLILEFETKYPDAEYPIITPACDALHHTEKAQEQATHYAAQCADHLARWIERNPVWNA